MQVCNVEFPVEKNLCTGIQVEDVQIPVSGEVQLPIPNASATLCHRYLTFVWPKLLQYNGEHCYCPIPLNRDLQLYYLFEDCLTRCGTEHRIVLDDEMVVVHHQNADSIEVHFFCEVDPCLHKSCFLESIVSSHRINFGDNYDTETALWYDNTAQTVRIRNHYAFLVIYYFLHVHFTFTP